MSRYEYVEYARSQIIGETQGWQATADARRENQRLEEQIQRRRGKWRILPAENMTVTLHKDTGAFPAGLTLSVTHEAGRMLLHKRLASIWARDGVSIDAVIDGSLEDVYEAVSVRRADHRKKQSQHKPKRNQQ